MAMEKGETYKKKIMNVIKKSYPDDLTTVEIARQVGIHRNTIVRYLSELVGEGRLKTRTIGKYVLYRLAK
jgi:DNA-binding IclR family transcriptional regulator